jgi:hypothetical protein
LEPARVEKAPAYRRGLSIAAILERDQHDKQGAPSGVCLPAILLASIVQPPLVGRHAQAAYSITVEALGFGIASRGAMVGRRDAIHRRTERGAHVGIAAALRHRERAGQYQDRSQRDDRNFHDHFSFLLLNDKNCSLLNKFKSNRKAMFRGWRLNQSREALKFFLMSTAISKFFQRRFNQ